MIWFGGSSACFWLMLLLVTTSLWGHALRRRWLGSQRGVLPRVTRSALSSHAQQKVEIEVDEAAELSAPNGRRSLPLNVYVDNDVRAHLKMRNGDRKARIYLPADFLARNSAASTTVKTLRDIVEKKFAPLLNQPYVLRYQLPGVMPAKKQFPTDEDVYPALEKTYIDSLPCIQLYVDASPGVFPPPSEPYLAGMPDPDESDSLTLLSFYRFFDIPDPDAMSERLESLWKPFRAVGRIYVATEGVNAQMAVPTNVLPQFQAACNELELLQDLYLNCDHLMTRQEFDTSRPFKALHIRVRDQIVADGLSEPLDWRRSGREVPPAEWHTRIGDPQAVVLDCRNSYETDVGVFQGAVPLNTTFFRESWDALDETLRNVPKDAPILTYCTGGIRCVKINAFLEQRLGFTNVGRLQGGIISYARELDKQKQQQQQQQQQEGTSSVTGVAGVATSTSTLGAESRDLSSGPVASKFKGINYVFDERMGARITADVLTQCETCGQPSDAFTNCRNFDCHVRFIQCVKCSGSYGGCCSVFCQRELGARLEAEAENVGGAGARISARQGGRPDTKQAAMTPRVRTGAGAGGEGEGGDVGRDSRGSRVIDASFPSDAAASASASSVPAAATTQQPPQHQQPPQLRAAHALSSSPSTAADATTLLDALTGYCERHSAPEPLHLAALRQETEAAFGSNHARMLSGHLQGRVLTLLAAVSGARQVLELGAFTGYSAMCLAEGLTQGQGGRSAASSNNNPNPQRVLSCEIDAQALEIARKYLAAAPEDSGARLVELREARASEVLAAARAEGATFDLVFIDADKKAYGGYLLELLGDEASGGVARSSGQCLLSDGALIVVDNTLWKGLVLQSESGADKVPTGPAVDPAMFGSEKRMIALAQAMHEFNALVKNQACLRPVVLPLRDGLSIIRFVRGEREQREK